MKIVGRSGARSRDEAVPVLAFGLGIVVVVGKLTFQGIHGSYYKAVCTNSLAVLPLYANGHTYCGSKNYKAGFATLEEYCVEYGSTNLLPQSGFAANLTSEAIAALPVYAKSQVNKTATQQTAFSIDKSLLETAYRTRDTYVVEFRWEAKFGYFGSSRPVLQWS